MKSEFEKARDIKIIRRHRPSTCDRCFEHGADWAFEWCQEEMGTLDAEIIFLKNDKVQLQKQLDQQAKIIEELKGALKEASKQFKCITYNTHNSYCVELANDANEEIKQVIKQTDKPDEV